MTKRDEEVLESIIPVLESMKRELDECESMDEEVERALEVAIAVSTKALSSTYVS